MFTPGKAYPCTPGFVFDGDTMNLSYQGTQFKCRLQWIDCPEAQKTNQSSQNPLILSHWEAAEKAKMELLRMVSDRQIIAIPLEKDQYDRWICDLYVGSIKVSTNIQINLCKLGLAVPYLPQYRWRFSTRELAILRGILTETARADRNKTGIWATPDFILPHAFKKLDVF